LFVIEETEKWCADISIRDKQPDVVFRGKKEMPTNLILQTQTLT